MSFGTVARDFSASSISIKRSASSKLSTGYFAAKLRLNGSLLQYERSPGVWITAEQQSVPRIQLGSKITIPGATSGVGNYRTISVNADGSVFAATYTAPANYASIFKNTNGTITQTALTAPGDAIEGIFQSAIAVSYAGDLALFCSTFDNATFGAIWPYTEGPSGTWTIGAKIIPSNVIGASALASISISEDSSVFVVGGFQDNAQRGAAWVFRRTGTGWTQQAKLTSPDSVQGTQLGFCVNISADGSTIACGAPDTFLAGHRGGACIFINDGTNWVQQGGVLVSTVPTPGSYQGTSVSLSGDGNTLALSAASDATQASGVGSVTIFYRRGNTWTQGQTLVARDIVANPNVQFARNSISRDGKTLVVSGSLNNSLQGAVWIYTQDPSGVWTQNGPGFYGSGAIGQATQGTSLVISADGNVLFEGGAADNTNIGALWIFV